jgi:hypothetical protein
MGDIFTGTFGYAPQQRILDPAAARAADAKLDHALAQQTASDQLAQVLPPRRILVTAVEVPGREAELARLMDKLARSRHGVEISSHPIGNRGKFENIAAAIAAAPAPPAAYDWLLIVDDDVAVGADFLDRFIGVAEAAGLVLAQPAHRLHSYAAYRVTQRHPGALARATGFVEIGPLTALSRATFDALLPFPATRIGWGVDFLWADIAARRGWRIGVVDAAPVEHLRPIAGSYDWQAALAEARALLAARDLVIDRETALRDGEIVIGWP